MTDPTPHSKADARRQRNLASAVASRQRRREQISSMTEETARLNEANAILRSRLHISDTTKLSSLAGASSSSGGPLRRSETIELGPTMQDVLRMKDMDRNAVVDLFDRAVSGSRGKGPPLDAAAAKRFAEAARKMPRDVERPLKYVGEKKKSSGKGGGSTSKKR